MYNIRNEKEVRHYLSRYTNHEHNVYIQNMYSDLFQRCKDILSSVQIEILYCYSIINFSYFRLATDLKKMKFDALIMCS